MLLKFSMELAATKMISKESKMFDLVVSGGDSFTFGAELADDISTTPSPSSWANLVAVRISRKHINTAKSGRSNSFIARQVLYQLKKALDLGIQPQKIFVQVMWTFTDRHEIALGKEIITDNDSPWAWITPYSNVDETHSEWFRQLNKSTKNYQSVKKSLKEKYINNKQLGIVDYATAYQKLTVGNNLNDAYISVKEILLLQNFLKLKGIKYFFTTVDYHADIGIFVDSSQGPGCQFIAMYRELIDCSRWYKFPESVGFCDWARKNNYEFATSHPLEKAHLDAADLIYTNISKKD